MTYPTSNLNTDYHIPVLFQETIAHLNIIPDGIYVDATFGGGGTGGTSDLSKGSSGGGLSAIWSGTPFVLGNELIIAGGGGGASSGSSAGLGGGGGGGHARQCRQAPLSLGCSGPLWTDPSW